MFKKIFLIATCLILTLAITVSAQPKKTAPKTAAKGKAAASEWKAEMTMADAINAALEAVADKYSDAEVFKADLRYTKKGGKFIIQLKVEDTKCVKVDVEFNGKTKVNDKKGEFFNVPKGSVKNQDSLPAPKPKASKKKAAADEDDDM